MAVSFSSSELNSPVEFFGIDVSEYITHEMIKESVREEYGNE